MKISFRIAIVGFAFLIGFPNPVFSQKFDNIWVMGYNWDSDPEAETYRLNFDTFPPQIEISPGDLRIDYAYAGICDSTGSLILYTNNCAIANGNGHIIEKGDSMTTGWELDWCKTYGWHPYGEQNILLPSTSKTRKVFSIYKTTYKSNSGPLVIYQDKVNYSIIDLDAQNGLGQVILKNRTALQGRLGYGEVTGVKHGNGRDWWLPIPEETGNKIFMLLYANDSLFLHHTEKIGPNWGNAGAFQASFSSDGTHYARYNRYYGLYLYDFDRCDGMLSNLRFFPISSTTQGLLSGAAFSPDNHLLYFADYDSLYQMDVTVADVAASKKLVAVYDGFNDGFLGTKFSRIAKGSDDRLYIVPPGSTEYMHIINRPNLIGESCNVQQHAIAFPNPYLNFPNHPNYRLGPLDGSPCDTLGIDNHPLADFRPDPTDTSALALRFWDVSSYEPSEWLWDFGDPASGGANMSQDTSPVHLFSAPGFYTVCLTVANQYSASSKCKVVEVKTSGVAEVFSGAGLRVYPNPTTGLLSVSGLQTIGCSAEVFDISGRKVAGFNLTDHSIDLTQMPPGLYFLQITRPGYGILGVFKVVVNH